MLNIIIQKLIQRKKENQRGATAVEFAIVILDFITIVFGIIEFGLLMYNQHIVTNAGREGARYGIVSRTERISEEDIEARVILYADQYIVTFGEKRLDVDDIVVCEQFGDVLSFEVTYDYDFLFLPFSRTITSTTRMRCE